MAISSNSRTAVSLVAAPPLRRVRSPSGWFCTEGNPLLAGSPGLKSAAASPVLRITPPSSPVSPAASEKVPIWHLSEQVATALPSVEVRGADSR